MLNYKKATSADARQIADLMIKLHKEDTVEELLETAERVIKNDVCFAACESEKIIAYIYGTIRRDYVEGSEQRENSKVGYIESLYVLPIYRRQGVARELCSMLETWAKANGAPEFASDAFAANKQSRAFHKAIGFTESKPIVHFTKKI